jgi:hypothetical protein
MKMMMNRLCGLIYGVLVYTVFSATLPYAIFFIGDIAAVPKQIDSGVNSPLLLLSLSIQISFFQLSPFPYRFRYLK